MTHRRRSVRTRATLIGLSIAALAGLAHAARPVDRLDRGVIALPDESGKPFISWRLLADDPAEIAFNVYRQAGDDKPIKLNDQPLDQATNFVDADPVSGARYIVRPVVQGAESSEAASAALMEKPYISIPLQTPSGYSPNDASAADLDGDGMYEIILHQSGKAHDNSHAGMTDPPILQAYKLDGTLMWSINLGRNIREGAHYTQFMVYDLDGDGRAELVCKTADGTTDGEGNVIGDKDANHVNDGGYILRGPEFLTAFDGVTGRAISTVDYVPSRYPGKTDPTGDELKAMWGDGYGNRFDRFLAGVAYLDGKAPSVVMCRGYYTRTFLAAFDLKDGKLVQRWVFDSGTPGNEGYAGQGNHGLSVADVDNDGRDEILYGGMAVDDDGRGLYTTRLGHGDAMHVSDLDPTRPGLETYRVQEPFADAGAHLIDSATGEVLWKRPSVARADGRKTEGPGRGLAADIDPRHPGAEYWSFGAGITGLVNIKGEKISDKNPPSCNFAVWWDGDELRELLDKTSITKWDWNAETVTPLLDVGNDCRSNNGTKATPTLSGDILGDWREEVIWPTKDGKELRIYSTTIPTTRRMVTLMQDPQYRLAIAWQNVGYNQPPHPSFHIGAGMSEPARAAVEVRPSK